MRCKYGGPYGKPKGKGKGTEATDEKGKRTVTQTSDTDGRGKAKTKIYEVEGTGYEAEEVNPESIRKMKAEMHAESIGQGATLSLHGIDAEGHARKTEDDKQMRQQLQREQRRSSKQSQGEGKGKGKSEDKAVTDNEGIDADDCGPQWFIREFHNEFAMITAMWYDVFGRLMTLAYNKGKGKGADMATDILINAAKGKGRGYVIGSERWPRCEEWPAWAERFVQQRSYYRSNETGETSADGGGSWHGG